MFTIRRSVAVLVSAGLVLSAIRMAPVSAQAPAEAASVKTWLDNPTMFEDYLKSAEVVGMEELKVGVTRPRRAKLAPGGPIEAFAWKTIQPGRHEGYWESYKSEIVAYELDKLLDLDMVPPTVEKRVKGDLGAAVMWVSPTKSFKELGRRAWAEGRPGTTPATNTQLESSADQGQDVRQPDRQHRPESRKLAGRSLVEPDPHRSHARVHHHEGAVSPARSGRPTAVEQDDPA